MGSLWSQEKYRQALNFAARVHHGQTMPDSPLPYLIHLALVTMEVTAALQVEEGWQGDLAVQCALLHDTLEDTPTSLENLTAEFGVEVGQGVLALTKNTDLAKSLAMADSLDRIRQQPKEIWLVKLADRIVNLSSPHPSWTREKTLYYRDEAWQIYQALAPASDFLAKRLQEKIEGYGV